MTKLLVIDTETGGLDPLSHSILSLGAVTWNEDMTEPVDTFECFIAEPKVITEPEAMKVNKIDLTELARIGKSPVAAVSLFHNFIRKHWPDGEKVILAGHCVDFDVQYVKRLFRLAGYSGEYEKLFNHRTLDTSGIGRFLALAGKIQLEPKSDALFDHFGVILTEQAKHTALGDAMATAMLLTQMVNFAKDLTLPLNPSILTAGCRTESSTF